ncbi:GPI biosynthesis protein family pig-F domain-containing protein [Ditylenchus destructor]|uniref:GPI biosynthesis protein family pig-F domain-containing protein n=1 Tax=Ditylenchus destructor TaxID=166010 RepID=A0AAD4R1Y3_9BILA|nr:GPI biosynthesis protein family pig-F domain-containing protein [Ditylenchus destructor]
MLLCSKIFTVLLSIPVFHILAVLFGAPLLSNFEDTFVFSLVLSALTVVPLLFVLESDDESLIDFLLHFKARNKQQHIAYYFSQGAVLGGLLGAVVIPLDWDRWWQKWPLPCIFGTIFGAALGFVFACCSLYAKRWSSSFKKHLKIV